MNTAAIANTTPTSSPATSTTPTIAYISLTVSKTIDAA